MILIITENREHNITILEIPEHFPIILLDLFCIRLSLYKTYYIHVILLATSYLPVLCWITKTPNITCMASHSQ